jgi:hypothetical protein
LSAFSAALLRDLSDKSFFRRRGRRERGEELLTR